jgi:hypothetical protein
MSIEAMSYAWKNRSDDADMRLLLLALADQADDDGEAIVDTAYLVDFMVCQYEYPAQMIQIAYELGYISHYDHSGTGVYRVVLNFQRIGGAE